MLLTYAMKDGQLIHITEVEKGAKCSCTCPACGAGVSAVKSDKSEHHFNHYKSTKGSCYFGSLMSQLIMAKDILEKEGKLYIPKVEFKPDSKLLQDKGIIEKGMFIKIDNAEIDDNGRRLVVYSDGTPLVIELDENTIKPDLSDRFIGYSCALDKYYSEQRVSAIQIQIGSNKGVITKDELRMLLMEDTENKTWLYNLLNEYYTDKILEFTDEIPLTDEKILVSKCPVHSGNMQNGLSFVDYCYSCKYLQHFNVDISYSKRDRHRNHPQYEPCEILCSAGSGVSSFDDLLKSLPPHEIPYAPNKS